MADRISYEDLNKLKKKFKVNTLWSWSRYNSYHNDPYGYMLKYIKHVPEQIKDSIWGISGGIVHDIIEDYYEKKITYYDMIDVYKEKIFEMDSMGLKYNRSNKELNDKTAKKYEDSIKHFFTHYVPLKRKVVVEKFITIKVGKYIFQGYIDFLHKDEDGNFIIEDFKTSTIYKGEKKENEAGQLLLYSQALIQRKVPINKIKLRWNFLKYCTVKCQLATKKKGEFQYKSKDCVRATWVKESESNIRRWIKKCVTEDELKIENMVQTCIENNNLSALPEEVQDKFILEDCYVYIDLTQEVINNLNNKIISTLEEIENKTEKVKNILKDIDNTDDDSVKLELEQKIDNEFWTEIDQSKEYYFYNLCGYNRNQHKPWNQYLNETSYFANNINSNININKKDDDLSWLNNL